MKLFAKNINNTGNNGIVDIDTNTVFCLCEQNNANIILSALRNIEDMQNLEPIYISNVGSFIANMHHTGNMNDLHIRYYQQKVLEDYRNKSVSQHTNITIKDIEDAAMYIRRNPIKYVRASILFSEQLDRLSKSLAKRCEID